MNSKKRVFIGVGSVILVASLFASGYVLKQNQKETVITTSKVDYASADGKVDYTYSEDTKTDSGTSTTSINAGTDINAGTPTSAGLSSTTSTPSGLNQSTPVVKKEEVKKEVKKEEVKKPDTKKVEPSKPATEQKKPEQKKPEQKKPEQKKPEQKKPAKQNNTDGTVLLPGVKPVLTQNEIDKGVRLWQDPKTGIWEFLYEGEEPPSEIQEDTYGGDAGF